MKFSEKYAELRNEQKKQSFAKIHPKIHIKPITDRMNKEDLFFHSINLKKKVNKLQSELDEKKAEIVKVNLNLKKEEKLLNELTKENQTELNKKENMKKGRDSKSVYQAKEKYSLLKTSFQKLQNETKNLREELSVGKQNYNKKVHSEEKSSDLIKEMRKIKDRFKETKNDIESNLEDINQLKDIKNLFYFNHNKISELENDSKLKEEENIKLGKEIDLLKEEISKMDEKLKKQNIHKAKLKISNEEKLRNKKEEEKYYMNYQENMNKLKALDEEVQKIQGDFGSLKAKYNSKDMEYKKLKETLQTPQCPTTKKYDQNKNKVIKYYDFKKEQNRIEILNSIATDVSKKCEIYEKTLKEKYQVEPEEVLKDFGYEGVIIESNTTNLNNKNKKKEAEAEKTNPFDIDKEIKRRNELKQEEEDDQIMFREFLIIIMKNIGVDTTGLGKAFDQTFSKVITDSSLKNKASFLAQEYANKINLTTFDDDINLNTLKAKFIMKAQSLNNSASDFHNYIKEILSSIEMSQNEDGKTEELFKKNEIFVHFLIIFW